MMSHEVTVVRIYIRESERMLDKVITFLHDQAKVQGVTVLRGIEGFGEGGELRTASLLDLSFDLPLIVEFYEDHDKVETIIAALVDEMQLTHVISFPARAYTRGV